MHLRVHQRTDHCGARSVLLDEETPPACHRGKGVTLTALAVWPPLKADQFRRTTQTWRAGLSLCLTPPSHTGRDPGAHLVWASTSAQCWRL